MRRLERLQWEFLYGLVTIASKYGGKNRHILPQREQRLLTVRINLCTSMAVAEELIPLKVLDQFFAKHEEYARLPHKYPQARILKDTLPLCLIDAYRSTFATDEVLPDCGFKMMHPKEYRCSWRACQVAEAAGYIAVPRACADAALVALLPQRQRLDALVLDEGFIWAPSCTWSTFCLAGGASSLHTDADAHPSEPACQLCTHPSASHAVSSNSPTRTRSIFSQLG